MGRRIVWVPPKNLWYVIYAMHFCQLMRTDQHSLQVVCVVDCPTPAHIPSLISSPTWEPYYSKEAGEEVPHNVNVVYHLIGTGVVEDELYKAWMARFGPNVHVCSRDLSFSKRIRILRIYCPLLSSIWWRIASTVRTI